MSLSMKRILVVLSVAANIAAGQQKNGSLSVASIRSYQPKAGCLMRPQVARNGRWSIPCTTVKYLSPTRVRASGLGNGIRTGLGDDTTYFNVTLH
jgi:hypothetical protein